MNRRHKRTNATPTRFLACLLLPLLLVGEANAFVWEPAGSSHGLEGQWREYLALGTAAEAAPGLPFDHCFAQAAQRTQLPVTLLQAVARGESNFDPRAVSHANALGVMQILWPGTARDLGIKSKTQAFDACTNIDAGARYLAQMLERYDNNLHAALIAYNRGPANVDRLLRTNRLAQRSWYSNYVWDHLGFVLDTQVASAGDYAEAKRLVFITFAMPFRAQELVQLLRDKAPGVRCDWFKRSNGGFAVAMHYKNDHQLQVGSRKLKQMGLLRREP